MIVFGGLIPGLPHPLLAPEQNSGWLSVREGMQSLRRRLLDLEVERIVLYSTMWPSVIGHQVLTRNPSVWKHVDELFHDLGTIDYHFTIDDSYGLSLVDCAQKRGLQMRAVNYEGFPIDTGSVVALSLVNAENVMRASVISSNVYADRAETVVLGKSVREAIALDQARTAVFVVGTLSNRVHRKFIEPASDHISSEKDEEWNQKILEFLAQGRLEDVSQLSRQIHREARVPKVNNLKTFWWLSSVMGAHNRYQGKIFAYAPVYGTGSAVIGLEPSNTEAGNLEFDEESPEVFYGDRDVLSSAMSSQNTEPGGNDELE